MILYILDIDIIKRKCKRYIFYSLFCFVFGLIYEQFSHGVYSYYMIYAFFIPLIMGFIGSLLIYILKLKINNVSFSLYNLSILTLTLGSFVKGALDIYGTTNSLVIIYLYSGIVLFLLSIMLYIKGKNVL